MDQFDGKDGGVDRRRSPPPSAAPSRTRSNVLLLVVVLPCMVVIARSYARLSIVPPSAGGEGCDWLLSKSHTSNRTVSHAMCVSHDAGLRGSSSALAREFAPPHYDDDDTLSFVVLGDFGRDGHCCQRDVAVEMARACSVLNCSFVLNTGDAFYGHGLLAEDEEQVRTSWRDVYLVHPELNATEHGWLSMLGNHEYRGSAEAVLRLAAADARFVMPGRNYSKLLQSGVVRVLVIVLDTSPMIDAYRREGLAGDNRMVGQRDGVKTQWHNVPAQLAWLRATLAAHADVAIKLVAGHHPVYTSGAHYGEDDDFLRLHLAPLLEEYRVAAYFCGHDHNLQYHRPSSASAVHYFGSAAGSKVNNPMARVDDGLRFFAQVPGFMAVRATLQQVHVAIVDYAGAVLYAVDIAVPLVGAIVT